MTRAEKKRAPEREPESRRTLQRHFPAATTDEPCAQTQIRIITFFFNLLVVASRCSIVWEVVNSGMLCILHKWPHKRWKSWR